MLNLRIRGGTPPLPQYISRLGSYYNTMIDLPFTLMRKLTVIGWYKRLLAYGKFQVLWPWRFKSRSQTGALTPRKELATFFSSLQLLSFLCLWSCTASRTGFTEQKRPMSNYVSFPWNPSQYTVFEYEWAEYNLHELTGALRTNEVLTPNT
jgi:hypothetical protein